MSAEIWFFYTPQDQSEITVLNRQSALNVVRLMTEGERKVWKLRKNRSDTVWTVAESDLCKEVEAEDALAAVGEISTEAPQKITSKPASEEALEEHDDLDLASANDNIDVPSWNGNIQVPPPKDSRAFKGLGTFDDKSKDDVTTEHSLLETNALPQFKEIESSSQKPPLSSTTQIGNAPEATVPSYVDAEALKHAPRQPGRNDYPEMRRYERFDVRLRVVVIAGPKSFRTFSKNISKGGICFEHIVPTELIGKKCRVIIGSADLSENIEFDARLTGDPHNPRAVEFQDRKEKFLEKLDLWLEDLSGKDKSSNAA